MLDACLGQLLILKAELLIPFWILSCFRSCAFWNWVCLILSILKVIWPVNLCILEFDFTIDIHGAEEGGQILWKLGLQDSADHQVVLLEIVLRPWVCGELLASLHLTLTWRHQHRSTWALRLLCLHLALRHGFSVPQLCLSRSLRFQPDLRGSSSCCCSSSSLVRCFVSVLFMFQIDLAHFLSIFDLEYSWTFSKYGLLYKN